MVYVMYTTRDVEMKIKDRKTSGSVTIGITKNEIS